MDYIKRIVDKEIEKKLRTSGAVVIRGPKWCGKTTSAKQFAKSILEMQNPDTEDNYKELANIKPSILLQGEKPRLIDEWQLAPKLWNAVRYAVDTAGDVNQFILTSSATPVEDPTMHSGVGRFSFVNMKPLSLYESGESNGVISLQDLLDEKTNIDGKQSNLSYEDLVYALCRGGWPNSLKMSKEDALEVAPNYLNTLVNSDISRIDGVNRDPQLASIILKSYSRLVSTIGTNGALFEDIKANYGDISEKTISDYLNVLKKLYIIEEISAWNPNIRSKTTIRTSPKKMLIDPSLAVAALGCSYNELLLDVNTLGLLFENLVNRDLSIYAGSIGGTLNHYRDRYGLECDNVIHFKNGKYALVEVKLSKEKIEEAEEHLLKLKDLISQNPKLKEPTFMMVITATKTAYKTENGILVVPIGCLKN
ncbi:MAG TPA: ATP-binding protein [Candidatus Onthocola stercoravium]|nr:ATP-binding protein [Candidatus Onthocola stercoravium]